MSGFTSPGLANRLAVRLQRTAERPLVTIRSAVPVLRVPDVEHTITWYRDVLGFHAVPFPSGPPPYEYAVLEHGGAELIVRRVEDLAPRSTPCGWDAYFRLSGGRIQRLYARLRQHGVRIVRELQRTVHGDTEFDIEDCNGYVLCFSELL